MKFSKLPVLSNLLGTVHSERWFARLSCQFQVLGGHADERTHLPALLQTLVLILYMRRN